jgi:hypothetical protein
MRDPDMPDSDSPVVVPPNPDLPPEPERETPNPDLPYAPERETPYPDQPDVPEREIPDPEQPERETPYPESPEIPDNPDTPAPSLAHTTMFPAPRIVKHTVHTARYRLVIKGPERGKWESDVVEEADAPLITVETVVRGVQRRAGEDTEIVRYSASQIARALRIPLPTADS